jgi:hypothetical protein
MKYVGYMSFNDYEDALDDARREDAAERRSPSCKCSDGMCGADDCERCHPEGCEDDEA